MPAPLTIEIREAIVRARDAGLMGSQICELLDVCQSTGLAAAPSRPSTKDPAPQPVSANARITPRQPEYGLIAAQRRREMCP